VAIVELREYQHRGVGEIRTAFAAGRRRVLYQAPTGSGKTILFLFVVMNAVARGRRVLIVVHRQELIDQVTVALAGAGVWFGVIAAGFPERPLAPVQVASINTLAHRLHRFSDAFDLVVIDECHHAVAPSWRRVLTAMKRAKFLGVTATPARMDGRGLGSIFDYLVMGPDVRELICHGYLAAYRVHVPAKLPDLTRISTRAGDYSVDELAAVMKNERLSDDAIADYLRLAPNKPAVVFCVDVAHSMAVANRFRSRRIAATHVDGDTERGHRREMIAALGTGRIKVLCNCGLISEGVDVPAIAAAILLRPTKSLTVSLQQIGRALRPAPDKEAAVILDHVGNVLRHGLPDQPRAWSLAGAKPTAIDYGDRLIRCTNCGALNPPVSYCAACGERMRSAAPPPRPAVTSADCTKIAAMPYREAVAWAGDSVSRLRVVATARGYKSGWIWMRVAEIRARHGSAAPRRSGAAA
jgi:DNA repair protein RadD